VEVSGTRDIPFEVPPGRAFKGYEMPIFRRKKPAVTEMREYESWEPSALAAAEDAASGGATSRSRTSKGHLQAAVDALEAAKVRDAT
jgi:hypothetical protein